MLAPRIFRSIPTRLKLNGPVLSYIQQPTDTTDNVVGEAVFTAQVVADFVNSPLSADGGYTFKWYFDNKEVDPLGPVGDVEIGLNESTLTLVGLDANDNDKEVYCVATYIFAGNESNALNNNLKSDVVKLTALDDINITTQPTDQLVGSGVAAEFICAAETEKGGKEIRFQWQLDGDDLVDGTSERTILDTTFPDTTTITIEPKFEVTSDKGDNFTIEWTKLTTFTDFKVDRTYTIVPNTNITTRLYLIGGGGGGSGYRNITGTYGGSVQGDFTFLKDQTYKLIRGQRGGDGANYSTSALIPGGFPGGGDSQSNPRTSFSRSGGGGGYTGLFITDVEHSNSIMIAGGGGGSSSDPASGGSGGGLENGEGVDGSNAPSRGGLGGTQTAGGNGGEKGDPANQGQDGSELKGGRGSNGGGGGAGYYGGGGGGETGPGAAGGGSSHYDDLVSNPSFSRTNSLQESFNYEQDGSVKIDFLAADYEITGTTPQPVYKTITTDILGARTPEMTITSNDSDFGGSIRCKISANSVRQSPLYTDTVAYDVKKARSLVVFEAYDVNNNLQTLSSNLDEGKLTINSESFGAGYNIITFFSKEKDFNLRMKIKAAAGVDKKTFTGGQGGMSIIDLRARKDVEYVILGLSNNSAVFVYEKSKLIACVGQGGAAGNEGNGGDGGGVNVSGKNGIGNRGGIAGERPVPGSLTEEAVYGSSMLGSSIALYPGDTIASDIFGGRTISCSRGRYWIDEGVSPCDDNSSTYIQYRGIDGNIVAGSSLLNRGFKPGYTVVNTAGAANGNTSGIGGNGATGGDGGANNSGGGGGSGYTDGTTIVTATRSGGNTEKVSTIEFSVTDTPGVDPEDPDFRD